LIRDGEAERRSVVSKNLKIFYFLLILRTWRHTLVMMHLGHQEEEREREEKERKERDMR